MAARERDKYQRRSRGQNAQYLQGEGVLPDQPRGGGDEGKGRVLMERGAFNANIVDPEMVIEGLGHMLRVWEYNRQARRRGFRRDRPRAERLRGLFGGR